MVGRIFTKNYSSTIFAFFCFLCYCGCYKAPRSLHSSMLSTFPVLPLEILREWPLNLELPRELAWLLSSFFTLSLLIQIFIPIIPAKFHVCLQASFVWVNRMSCIHNSNCHYIWQYHFNNSLHFLQLLESPHHLSFCLCTQHSLKWKFPVSNKDICT